MYRPFTKIAAGDIQTFENSLATIGRSTIAPKAPALFQHEVGFQVLDSDEEYTRAVAVFGFRVGGRLLYIPMFYRNGTIKGTEQLRDPKRKITVPLSDNWVNKFLSEAGDRDTENVSRSDIKGSTQPTLWQFKFPPSKYASDWVHEVKLDLARVIANPPKYPDNDLDLIKAAEEHPQLIDKIGGMVVRYPWFGDALKEIHGVDRLEQLVKAAEEYQKRAFPSMRSIIDTFTNGILPKLSHGKKLAVIKVTSIRMHGKLNPNMDLDEDDKDELREGRNVYKDDRDDNEKSKVRLWLSGEGDKETLSNPPDSGIYEVLMADGSFKECVVLTSLVSWEQHQGKCVVAAVSGDDRAYTITHRNSVWVKGEGDISAFKKFVQDLPKVSKDKLEDAYRVAILNPTIMGIAAASEPFSVDSYDDDGRVYPCSCMGSERDRPFWAPYPPEEDRQHGIGSGKRIDHTGCKYRIVPNGGRLFVSANRLMIPDQAKVLKLGHKKLTLGDGTDPDIYLNRNVKKAMEEGCQPLVLTTGSGEIYVNNGSMSKEASIGGKNDAEATLVESFGLDVKDARKLIDHVERYKQASVWVKYAASYDTGLARNWPNAPTIGYDQEAAPAGFADDIMPTETASTLSLPIQDMMMQPGAAERYRQYPVEYGVNAPMPGVGNTAGQSSGVSKANGPDGKDLETVESASRTGKRELFDTAALGALVKNTRLQSLKQKISPKLLKTVSDLGDMLAHMYWNVDEWADQFGETEIGPLEDHIKGLFEGLGELYLTLQEKSVNEGPDTGVLPEMDPGDGADGRN